MTLETIHIATVATNAKKVNEKKNHEIKSATAVMTQALVVAEASAAAAVVTIRQRQCFITSETKLRIFVRMNLNRMKCNVKN